MTNAGEINHALFPTTIGTVGVAWSEHGLVALALPERDEAITEKRLIAKSRSIGKAEPPEKIAKRDCAHSTVLRGRARVDFSTVPLDLSGVDADRRRIYETMRALAFGETTTYGALARQAGADDADWEAAREVGVAMGRNPIPIVVPCHRVLAAGGKPGGFSAYGGTATKEKLLALEGVHLGGAPRLPGL